MQDDFATVKEENWGKRDAFLQLLSSFVSRYCGAQRHFLLYEMSSMSDGKRRLQPLHGMVERFRGGRFLDFLRVHFVLFFIFLRFYSRILTIPRIGPINDETNRKKMCNHLWNQKSVENSWTNNEDIYPGKFDIYMEYR